MNQTKGFVVIELIVVIVMLGILYVLAIKNNVFNAQHTNSINTTIDSIVSDLSSQQNRSMSGDMSTGTVATSYGIYFQSSSYTIFKGNSYSANDPWNFVIQLDPNLQFSSITLSGNQIVFATASGMFNNYSSGHDTVVLKDTTTSTSKTIHINPYGVVDTVN